MPKDATSTFASSSSPSASSTASTTSSDSSSSTQGLPDTGGEVIIPGDLDTSGSLIVESASSTDYTGVATMFGFAILLVFMFTLLWRILHQETN